MADTDRNGTNINPESQRTVGVVALEDVVEELVGEVRELAQVSPPRSR